MKSGGKFSLFQLSDVLWDMSAFQRANHERR